MRKGECKYSRVGEERINCQGITMRIVEYNKTNNIKVLFLNGHGEICKTRYEHFISGKVRCYSWLIGERRTNQGGISCVAIECIGKTHVKVRFDSGLVGILRRSSFNTNSFSVPKTHQPLPKGARCLNCNENYYADEFGNIYNNNGMKLKTVRRGAYMGVSIPIDGEIKSCSVHRLIAETFLPNPNHLPQVNHKDGNKHNNALSNLEWVTASENQRHACQYLGKNARGENNSQHKLKTKEVIEIRELSARGADYKELARQYDVAPTTIHSLLHGRSWTHIPTKTMK